MKNWLAHRREQLKLYQADLVALLEEQGIQVARSSISNWESGRFAPPLDDPGFRRALANALRMTIPEMLAAAGYEIDSKYSPKAMRAADIVDQLPEKQSDLALSILEQMLMTTRAS